MGKYLYTALLVPALYPLLAYVSTSPIPGGSLYNYCIFIMYFSFIVAGLACIAGIVMLFLENGRVLGVTLLVVGGLYFPLSNAAYDYSSKIQKDGFLAFAKRSDRLVTAISLFEKEKGKAPENLSELVPKYLKEVPGTEMSAYPLYQYNLKLRTGDAGNKQVWSLSAPASQSFWDKDLLYYSPYKDYSEFQGGFDKIGDWILVRKTDFYFRKNPNAPIVN